MKNNNNSSQQRNNHPRYSDERDSGSRNNNNYQSSNNYDNKNKQEQRQSHQQQDKPQHHHHQQQQPSPHRNQQQQQQQHHPYQSQRDRSGQRDRSSQRTGQHPDSSVGRDGLHPMGNQSNLGSVKFTPGYPTRELPPIETKADPTKKFMGRCRLFVGNLPHNTTEEKLRGLFEPFGEIGEIFLGPKSAYAFVKMDTKHNAEASRDALDCSVFDGRPLRVRLAAHAAAIRIKHLSSQVTNELLAYAFRYFGEIERAVVVVDDKGKSTGEGIVEYSRKQSAQYAIKRCQQECFMLTASPMPVLVEPYDQQDEDEGLPEKSVNRNSIEFKDQRDVGPRFAEQGTFEYTFAQRWKDLYAVEKQKREHLEQEVLDARKNLEDQIEYSRLEHETMQLRNKLQHLEDNRMKLQHLKEQGMTDVQQRDDQRRQQDMMMKQREEEILRRQQLDNLGQQESALRSQAHVMQNIITVQESTVDPNIDTSQQQQQQQQQQQNFNASGPQMGQEIDPSMQMNQMMSQAPRTFADAAMMGMNQQYIHVQQPNMGMPLPPPTQTPQNMFPSYIPPPPIQGTLGDNSGNNYGSYQQQQQPPSFPNQSNKQPASSNNGRQNKFNRQGNNIALTPTGNAGGRPRKRGRF